MRIQKDDLLAFMRQREMPIPRRLLPRLSLLVIDDEATYVNALRQSLQRADARLVVDACSSGLDGLLRVGADMPDAVLVDALMPGVDGLDFCRIVKAHPRTRNIPVVGMSGRGAAYQDRFKAAGAAAFLEKPFTAKEVLEVLRRVGALPPREMVR